MGAFIFNSDPSLFPFNDSSVLSENNIWVTIDAFSEMMLYAIVAWLLTCMPIFALVYFAVVAVLRRVAYANKANLSGNVSTNRAHPPTVNSRMT